MIANRITPACPYILPSARRRSGMVARQVRRSVVMSNLQIRLLPMDSDRTPLEKGKDVLHGAARAAPLRQSVEQPCVGARLDEQPQLLFVLRNVDEHELLASAGQDLTLAQPAPSPAKVLEGGDLAALFGLEMAEPARTDDPGLSVPKPGQSSKRSKGLKAPTGKKTSAAKKSNSPRGTRAKSASKEEYRAMPRKMRAQH